MPRDDDLACAGYRTLPADQNDIEFGNVT